MKLVTIFLTISALIAFAGDYQHFQFKAATEALEKGQRTGHCLLHKRDMIRKRVPVIYGYNYRPHDDTVPQFERVLIFPHSLEGFLSDKAGQKRTPKTALVYICPDCRESERKWKQENPK